MKKFILGVVVGVAFLLGVLSGGIIDWRTKWFDEKPEPDEWITFHVDESGVNFYYNTTVAFKDQQRAVWVRGRTDDPNHIIIDCFKSAYGSIFYTSGGYYLETEPTRIEPSPDNWSYELFRIVCNMKK